MRFLNFLSANFSSKRKYSTSDKVAITSEDTQSGHSSELDSAIAEELMVNCGIVHIAEKHYIVWVNHATKKRRNLLSFTLMTTPRTPRALILSR
jgi:hypothetical protein